VTIDLLPDVERWLAGKARQHGTTLDALVNDYLRELKRNDPDADAPAPQPGSMAEFLEGYVGVFDSRTIVPGGARLSEATGEQFADILEEKRAQGHI
jgi:hypothetical protein